MIEYDIPIVEEDIPVAVPYPGDYTSSTQEQHSTIPLRDPTLSSDQIKALIEEQGYTKGLCKALSESISDFALRIWVIDNSGSMANNDGQKLISDSRSEGLRSIQCTRWNEIQETVEYHSQMAALMKAPTIFRLLNDPGPNVGPQVCSIAETRSDDNGGDMIEKDLNLVRSIMAKAHPTGATPLITHINEIREQVEALEPMLRRDGRRVAIILATDGLPTNPPGFKIGNERENFTAAMKSLEGLPVWIVIRLCTDSEHIVNYYNDLDKQMELSIEVLDNYTDEAMEMFRSNPWLNYTLQLHRMREMGLQKRLFDVLDERPLTLSELHDYCIMVFGEDALMDVPSPERNFKEFCKAIKPLVKGEEKQWHPVRMMMKDLVSVDKMKRVYGDGGCMCNIM